MKTCLVMAFLAGTAVSTCALAQDLVWVGSVNREVRVSPVGFPGRTGGYEQRDILPVYDNIVGGGFFLGNCTNTIDDIGFANGPWEQTGPAHTITEMTYGVYAVTTDVVDEQNLVILWRKSDVNFEGFGGAGTNMIRPGAAPLQVIRVDFPPGPPAGATNVTVDLTGLPGGGVVVPAGDDGLYIQVAWITNGFTPSVTPATTPNPDWSNLSANASGSTWGGRGDDGLPLPPCPFAASDRSLLYGNLSNAPSGGNPAVPGFTLRDYGRDIANGASPDTCPHVGQFIGNGGPAVSGGQVEHRYIAPAGGSDAQGYRVQLKGDVNVSIPSPLEGELGCVPDTGLTTSSSVTANHVKWYSVCINGDVQDVFRQYADFDTEGSAGDVCLGLYATNGSVLGTDDNSGSGNNAQLTYGVGIRASAGGDGRQYDGRNGEFIAGTYYLAVAPGGSTFHFGFNVTPSANPGGAYRVNIHTNTNTGVLAPSVAPAIGAGHDMGDASNGAESSPADVTSRGIAWFKFSTDFDTATTLDKFVDIGLNGTGADLAGDPQVHMFDSAGNLVAVDDDSGPGTLSQLSFSHPAADGGPADRPAADDGLPFAGQNGDLAAGTYYLGVGIFEVLALAEGDRWHLRATANATTTTTIKIATALPTCPICAADFNLDGGVDGADVEAFFLSWEAGDSCGDVNLDGGVDGGDVESFFIVWENGGC